MSALHKLRVWIFGPGTIEHLKFEVERISELALEERRRLEHENDVLLTQLSARIAELKDDRAAAELTHESELARMAESRDYFRQRMERYELLLHPGLVPRDPKDKRAPVVVNSGPRRKSWPQLLSEHAAEEFDPEKVKDEQEKEKKRREEIARKSLEAIAQAKEKMRRRTEDAGQLTAAVAPQQEDSHEGAA